MAYQDNDPTAVSRKKDHIELALKSETPDIDKRFYYEPLFAAHPKENSWGIFDFLGKKMNTPLWVSSMTGGTAMARTINYNLARACGEFGMGMGLGSCRALLFSDEHLSDFDVRHLIGDAQPLFANLGIAQLEQLIKNNQLYLVDNLIDKLKADGLIIHVNPMQEWMQPEGDVYEKPALETILTVLEKTKHKIIVKEVGQGFGYESLKTLFQLPLEAIDFAAAKGTNFAKLELLRSDENKQKIFENFVKIGHDASEMVDMSNEIIADLGDKIRCKQVIISGGIKDFLDGYYLVSKLNTMAVYGMASGFLSHARGEYEELQSFVSAQTKGLEAAKTFLRIKSVKY
jgi:isopentenyl-diphosphate Delta-isomerase